MAPPGPFGGILVGLFLLAIGGTFLVVGGIVAVASVHSGYRGLRVLRSDVTPLSDLRNRPSGPVEVEGTVVEADDLETLTAPLSGVECYAHTTIRERGKPNSADSYSVVARGTRAVRFAIEDAVGHEVAVDPEAASLSLDDTVATVAVREPLDEDARQRLRTLPENETEFSGRLGEDDLNPGALVPPNNMSRHREKVLVPGDEVHVYGATTQAAASRRRLAELTGSDFFTITEGDESDQVKRQVTVSAVFGFLGLAALGFGIVGALAGAQFVLGPL